MKKNLLIALAAAGALASCSNDETLKVNEAPQGAIGFSTFVDKATRADMTTGNLQNNGFKVWGGVNSAVSGVADLFVSQQVDYTSGAWTYTPLRYWTPDNDYAFTALAPLNDAGNPIAWTYTHDYDSDLSKFTTKRHGEIAFNQADGQGTTDLVLASAIVVKASSNQEPVGLSFGHLLSKVRLQFVNGFDSENSLLTVENVKLTSAGTASLDLKGYDVTAPVKDMVWTGLAGSFTSDHKFAGESKSNQFNNGNLNGSTPSSSAFIIPTAGELTITFTARLYTQSGGTTVEVSPAEGWAHTVVIDVRNVGLERLYPGYAYTFIAELNNENTADSELNPIQFTAQVNDWEEWHQNPYIIPNKTNVTLTVGNTWQITGHPSDGGAFAAAFPKDNLSYESDDPAVATVSDEGVITAVAAGTAHIKVTYDGYEETVITVTVND